ncbi:MAG: hypothetical protein QN163_05470 [Armatimonadota bacterium]|nr:hypothetical protein [Armatimonadota bacterium]MDR5696218.1 hypothetical protein [Armatimonadota bacterium]
MERFVTIWLHVVAAAVLVGGGVVLALAVLPYARRLQDTERAALVEGVGRRLRAVTWLAILVLFVTGLYQLHLRGLPVTAIFQPDAIPGRFGQALAWKLLLFWLLVLLNLFHDFYFGPRALRLVREAYGARADQRADLLARADRLRRTSGWIGRLSALIAMVILYFAVILARS